MSKTAGCKTAGVRYTFREDVVFAEVEETLLLALFGVESLHGEAPARLEAGHLLDRPARVCLLACASPAGQDLNALFAGFLRRQFGPTAFRARARRRRHLIFT